MATAAYARQPRASAERLPPYWSREPVLLRRLWSCVSLSLSLTCSSFFSLAAATSVTLPGLQWLGIPVLPHSACSLLFFFFFYFVFDLSMFSYLSFSRFWSLSQSLLLSASGFLFLFYLSLRSSALLLVYCSCSRIFPFLASGFLTYPWLPALA